jgi:hypothetical protein
VIHFFLCLAVLPGCGRVTPTLTPDEPTLTPDELAANWAKHKGQTVVLSGSPKIADPGHQLAIFEAGGNYRIFAEVAEGSEKLKSGQPCKLQGRVKGLEGKTIVLEKCQLQP